MKVYSWKNGTKWKNNANRILLSFSHVAVVTKGERNNCQNL